MSRFEPWAECILETHQTNASVSHVPHALILPVDSSQSSNECSDDGGGGATAATSSSLGACGAPAPLPPPPTPPDTSRFKDGFSKLFFYETQHERERAYDQIVTFLHEILSSFSAQRLGPEVIHHWTHLIHLHDTDFLHLQFFMLMLSHPPVVRKLAAMTDPVRFCAFSDWLLHTVILTKHDQLARLNAHELVHAIRFKWTTM